MTRSDEKLLQYLHEARATELALVRVLQSQILMTPRGEYRRALESHLDQTRGHARRLEQRIGELGGGGQVLQSAIGFVEGAIGQALALAKAPLEVLRGSGGEEKVLKNAKDTCATEALEIATYTAIERLAGAAGDEPTARLAASIRVEEERMLERVLRQIPRLTDMVIAAELDGDDSYDIGATGAADTLREAGAGMRSKASGAAAKGKRTARKARKVPGVARTEGRVKGALASAGDLAIAGYDELTAAEIVERLPSLSQIELAKIEAYERRNQDRSTITGRIDSLQAEEPWPGYDELNATEIRTALARGDDGLARSVLEYERSHKSRSGVIDQAQAHRERERERV